MGVALTDRRRRPAVLQGGWICARECLYLCVSVCARTRWCSGLDEQHVSGPCEVSAGLSAEMARKTAGVGGGLLRKGWGQNQLNDMLEDTSYDSASQIYLCTRREFIFWYNWGERVFMLTHFARHVKSDTEASNNHERTNRYRYNTEGSPLFCI